jgi:hypothetical protein
LTRAPLESIQPSLVWTGWEFGVAWADNRNDADGSGDWGIYFARVSELGVKLGDDVRVSDPAADAVDPSLVWTGTQYGVAWKDFRDAAPDLYEGEIYFATIETCR